ncbi:MAG: inverse autotransporter beta domain-containing protein, partial [Legionellales bacterium]|nr:inverse autotransporter beta domain-containing protein [Legionellales bacterium]
MMNFNLKKILILFISLHLLASYGYSPRLELEFKGGNKRHIGRYGTLIPLYESRNSLLFSNMFLMHDTKSSVEGNFGLGFRRQISNKSILGIYGFWDIRRIKNVIKKIHQATFGLEYLMSRFELRINGYLPQNKKFLLNTSNTRNAIRLTRSYDASVGPQGQTVQTIDYNLTTNSKYEVPLAGFDAEIGGNIFRRVETHGAYYHFNGRKGAKSVNGWRFRSILYLL